MVFFFLPLLAYSFSFNLFSEPFNLDPAQLRGGQGNYVAQNIYAPLFRFEKKLIPEGAKKCYFSSSGLKLTCELNPLFRFSDGSPVLARHYVYAFQRLLSVKPRSSQIELLWGLKNFQKILNKKASLDQLGIKAPKNHTLIFELEKPDKEFMYRLISPTLSAQKESSSFLKNNIKKLVTTGPYKVKTWKKGQHMVLTSNPYYLKKIKRPDVKVFFLSDNTTALNLYKKGVLSFLRRVETSQIPVFQKRDDFYRTAVLRLDYIGFNSQIDENLRKALAHSIDYKELQKLYHSRIRPGCADLSLVGMKTSHCYKFNLKKARVFLKKTSLKPPYFLYFSRLGGKDHLRGMQFIQRQWKKHLNLNVVLRPAEQKSYLQKLKNSPPHIFRKGLSLDRPTCKAALEIFTPSHPENYIKLNSSSYNKLVNQNLCDKGLDYLIKNYHIIPMGSIDFSMLASSRFQGWKLNLLNVLDLSELTKKPKAQKKKTP